MECQDALTFDDVLLDPRESSVLPAETDLRSTLFSGFSLEIPVLSAAMDTVSEWEMAVALDDLGGAAVLHKNMPPERQLQQVEKARHAGCERIVCAVGIEDEKRIELLVAAGVKTLSLDSAHGHSSRVLQTVSHIRERFPSVGVIAGNVVTEEGARALVRAGAHAVKVGLGSGSICTTRIVSGVGVPQWTALQRVVRALKGSHIGVISDGGIRSGGDIVKALACGADAVMLGKLLAGSKESPGERLEKNGKTWKYYRGMGSAVAMAKGSRDRYMQMGAGKLTPEGVESYIPYTGPLRDVVGTLMGGVRAGLGYVGAHDLKDLRARARWLRITPHGLVESHPHDVEAVSS